MLIHSAPMTLKTLLTVVLFTLPASAAKDLTVDDVVSRYVQARGGERQLKAIHSLKATGKAIYGEGGSFTLVWGELVSRPGMIRDEETMQGLTAVEGFDGKQAWSVSPFEGKKDASLASADHTKDRAQDADAIDGPLVGWRQKGHQVEYLGTEDVEGTQAHKLRVRLKDGDTLYVFLDPDYFLEIREITHRQHRGSESVSETDFGNYHQVNGVWFPFSFASGSVKGPKTSRYVIDRLEANPQVDDTLFAFPAPGAQISAAVQPSGPAPQAHEATPKSVANLRPPTADSAVISGLGARNIGSAAISGRVSALAATRQEGKTTLFVGAASGGVWRSTDDATTFTPVFDKQPVQSIGAIAIDPQNPKTVWVGTGESWTRNSVSVGDGIYKSTDSGDTWTLMGLPGSERIARIIVSPKDSSVVYVCVPGKLWSDSADRGVYKTADGGKSWQLILHGQNLSTGCSGLTMDSKNPEVLFAGLWDFRRKGWTFRSGGEGPDRPSGSGLFRTADGGRSWSELAPEKSHGIPAKPWGRVEVTVAPSDPKVVYAFIESKDSALYRSDDGGATWERRDSSQYLVWRPFYFARLVVDPKNPDRVFKPDLSLLVSDDGGKSFSLTGGGSHGDWHDLWIDPENPKHIIGGDDGGLWLSWDGGSRWWKAGNLPIAQFYHVAVDAKDPYQVYGGLQDNSSWVGDSSYPGGVTNSRWENLFGGDGFWTVVDPSDEHGVYAESQGGNLGRVDRRTLARRNIMPTEGYHEKLRFNWNTPIATSPTHKETLYLGAQFLFRSLDRGETWARISPDLTTNDPAKQKQEESGGVTVDNSSAEMHTTIYSISESPKDDRLVWVGTDDGNLQLTRDSGKTWTNVVKNVKGLPPSSWVSWVEASRFDAATAYAAFDRHTFGDLEPWVYRTQDYGKTWKRIAGPEQRVRGYAHVVKEDVVKPNLLFLGTELGLWVSTDSGQSWAQFKGGGLPSVAVRDLQVHPRDNDLVIATHGRGIWIVDDLTPLRELTPQVLGKELAFLSGRPIQQRMPAEGGWPGGDAAFHGSNPAGDGVITYYQKTRHLFGPMTAEVLDASGKVVETIVPSEHAGLNRLVWSMHAKPPRVPRAASAAYGSSEGPRVAPGKYTVRLTRGSQTVELPLDVGVDRRAPYGVAERTENFDAAMRVHGLFGEESELVEQVEALRTQAADRSKVPSAQSLAPALTSLTAHLDELRKKIVATKEGGAITGEERIREHTDSLYGALMTWEGRPTSYQLERIEILRHELADVKGGLAVLEEKEIAPLNEKLKTLKLSPLLAPTTPSPSVTLAPREAELLEECLQGRGQPCELDAPAMAATNERD
jgi:photosystem II stability/assembly factor-like uncharacterized protein